MCLSNIYPVLLPACIKTSFYLWRVLWVPPYFSPATLATPLSVTTPILFKKQLLHSIPSCMQTVKSVFIKVTEMRLDFTICSLATSLNAIVPFLLDHSTVDLLMLMIPSCMHNIQSLDQVGIYFLFIRPKWTTTFCKSVAKKCFPWPLPWYLTDPTKSQRRLYTCQVWCK